MTERLTFNPGTAALVDSSRGTAGPTASPSPPGRRPSSSLALPAVRPDLPYWCALAFTALVFFRPQDTIPALELWHLTEIVAIVGLASLASRRLSAGLPLVRFTPELLGVVGLALVMLATAPFSIWPGGAINTLLEVYIKVVLIYFLLTHAVHSPALLRRLTWVVLLAMAYFSVRGVFDYVRGLNLMDGRLAGPADGMMGNPNDFAMNMVSFLPFAIVGAFGRFPMRQRLAAGGISVLMLGTFVLTNSRGGMLGLVVMFVVLLASAGRLRAGLMTAMLVGSLVALPAVPKGVWLRMASITEDQPDDSGSKEARLELMREGWQTFLRYPLTGVGANQFRNYNPPGRTATWLETHNVVLQVLSELGIAGGALLIFLFVRSVTAVRRTRRLLPPERRPRRERPASSISALAFRPDEAELLRTHAAACAAGFAGWFTCAMFASVGYYWTFYYLLAFIVIARDLTVERTLLARRAAATPVALKAGTAA